MGLVFPRQCRSPPSATTRLSAPALIDLSDTIRGVTSEELKILLRGSKSDSTLGFDQITYSMIDSVATNHLDLILAIFNGLLQH